jgi:predicted permease
MGIPLLVGRVIAESDTAQAPAVVVVNQTLARRFWPGASALGGRLSLDQQARVAEIVGVVGDVKAVRMDGEDWPTIYSAYAQVPTSSMTLVAHVSGSPMGLAAAVRKEVAQLDHEQPVADVRPMQEVVDLAMAGSRFNTVLLVTFAVMAFVLASVGIYGVVSYDVSRRTNEIGIRMALGAQPDEVRKLILGQGARLAVYGIVAGWIGAGLLNRWMGSMLYGVSPTDAWTFGAISILLAVVALLASYLPSRRAMGLDPMAALRHE